MVSGLMWFSSFPQAVERLIHPTLCEQCIEFLERRLFPQLNCSVERAGEEVLHAFILVHTKLLAFYSRYRLSSHIYPPSCLFLKNVIIISIFPLLFRSSSRNASALSTSDLLALIIMGQSMYPSNMELDDPSPEVENGSHLLMRHHHSMFLAVTLLISTVFVCLHPSRRVRVHLVLAMRVFTLQSLPLQTKTPAVQVCRQPKDKKKLISECNALSITVFANRRF